MWSSYPNNLHVGIWLFWKSYVNIIYQHHIPTICTMKMMFTYDFGWCSHMILSDVCIWFTYMMLICDVHIWGFFSRIWFSVYDAHIWFSSIIICMQAYDHMREIIYDLLTGIWCSHMSKHAYDDHIWSLFPLRCLRFVMFCYGFEFGWNGAVEVSLVRITCWDKRTVLFIHWWLWCWLIDKWDE